MSSRDAGPGSKSHVDEALEMAHTSDEAELLTEDIDPASYRDLTKEEVLDRIAAGYKSFLAGKHRPIHELLEELDAMDD